MPGRILQEDVDLVRERSPVADVIGEYVELRPAGGGSFKGLCPFHDERTPSFTVTPGRGLYFCHGCHEGGDVIRFVMRAEYLPFAAATERLAARAGIQLRYEQGGRARPGQAGQRQRLAEVNQAAGRFYAAQLGGPGGEPAREFLAGLGAGQAAVERAGAGWAPEGGGLAAHLAARGFTAGELLRAGVARRTGRGEVADAFTRRLMWPALTAAGDTAGFAAQDIAGGGYLWTPQTALFRRDQLLYGADLARREIGQRRLALVAATPAEVLACRAAGLPVAVCACGAPLGEEHARALRDLAGDPAGPPGEVTLVLPEPGAADAAARALPLEAVLGAPLYAVTLPDGLTVAGLRAARGAEAVRELIARRAPLAGLAVQAVLSRHDLGTPAGRDAAAAQAGRVIARVPDRATWPLHAAELAARPGFPSRDRILDRARQAAAAGPEPGRDPYPGAGMEREVLRLAVQRPWLAGPEFDALPPAAFTVPAHAGLLELILSRGGTAAGGADWPAVLLAAAHGDQARALVTELAAEPLRAPGEPDGQYADMLLARLRERHAGREITAAMARLQQASPAADPAAYRQVIGGLMELSRQRDWLADRAAPRARTPPRSPDHAAPRTGRPAPGRA